ncbi:hypothetical protein EAI_00767 [Harpegnathos saltator]|uniref:Uncharacterized protein n=1 Tax=Harpegnathos saltator TaxID=610380 RepID=E2BDZ0_HARSA|nr:hypothetical protein EAI_00767 [Harpegnathos saltator]
MRCVKQPTTICVTNFDNRMQPMFGQEARRHGNMLPNTTCGIICGPSNCGKTNVLISLLESLHGLPLKQTAGSSANVESNVDIKTEPLSMSTSVETKSVILKLKKKR